MFERGDDHSTANSRCAKVGPVGGIHTWNCAVRPCSRIWFHAFAGGPSARLCAFEAAVRTVAPVDLPFSLDDTADVLTARSARPRRVRILLRVPLILVVVASLVMWCADRVQMGSDWQAFLVPLALTAAALPLLHLAIVRPLTIQAAAAEAARSANEAMLVARTNRVHFDTRLRKAFDMAVDENAVLDACELAVSDAIPGSACAIGLVDPQGSGVTPVESDGPAPFCGVSDVAACPALRGGVPVHFPSAEAFDACPNLRRSADGATAATCAPLMFMGSALGVLHVSGTPDKVGSPEALDRMAAVCSHTSARLGTLRVFEESQMHAQTDELTGLANRRVAVSNLRDLFGRNTQFAVVLADLDHFKVVNDTYGHEGGDRALRLFAQVVSDVVRPGDLVARYGGEEILLVLPGASAPFAAQVAERVRAALAVAVADGRAPAFTSSYGVADSGCGRSVDGLLAAADGALYAAKRAGRDRVEVACQSTSEPGRP